MKNIVFVFIIMSSVISGQSGDIASTDKLRLHYQSSTDDFSIFQGLPGSGILHFSVVGDKGTTTVRTTDINPQNNAFVIMNDATATYPPPQFGGNPVFTVKNNGQTTIETSLTNANAPFTIHNAALPGMNPWNKIPFEILPDGTTHIGNRRATGAYNNAKLTIDGTMVVNEIWVLDQQTAGWADYVFAKNYKLRAWQDLDEYIKKNLTKINRDSFQLKSLTSLPEWDTLMGFQFENMDD